MPKKTGYKTPKTKMGKATNTKMMGIRTMMGGFPQLGKKGLKKK